MKLSLITAVVLSTLCLQSCTESKARVSSVYSDAAPKATAPKLTNAFNGIVLDTAYDNTVVFIDNADDSEAVAYGHLFQFNGAEITEISIAVPYALLSYDLDTKLHSIDVKAFLKALNDGDNKANMFVKYKSLAGHNYNRTDTLLNN